MIHIDNTMIRARIAQIQLFLLDLDGTVYLEDELIPGVKEFVTHLEKKGIPFVFLTNNSSCNTADYIDKLRRLGITTTEKYILTSGQATGYYLSKKKGNAHLFVIGTDSLKEELQNCGHTVYSTAHENIEQVIVGFDTELTYQKIRTACSLLENGARFIATNPDLVCPIKNKKYIPDCGSICSMIENATGKQPTFIGKPHSTMVEIVRARFGIHPSKMAIIGDRLYTDIALGCNAGIYSICVLSGESTLSNILASPYQPDSVISSINFLNGMFE